MQNDAADELLKRVMAGESEALELWFKTRAWVISGQRKTLARLGVAFDRVFFESDFLEDGAELTRSGACAKGSSSAAMTASSSTTRASRTWRRCRCVRADGQTTQHMRAVSYWMGCARPRGRHHDPDHRHRVGRALDLHPQADGPT